MQRTFNPRTREQDERTINRALDSFNGGMYPDVVPNKVPQGAVSYLDNARAVGDTIVGRTGSIEATKLLLPYIATGVTFDRVVDEITITSDHTLSGRETGFKLSSNDGNVCFIEQINGDKTATVSGNYEDGSSESMFDQNLRGPINASHINLASGHQYYLIGSNLYIRIKDNLEWSEYTIVGDLVQSTLSNFHVIGDTIFLVNSSGIYKLSDNSSNLVAIQMNQALPKYKLNKTEIDASINPSAYNYLYGYARLLGDIRESRRSTDTFISIETPPHLQEGKETNDVPGGDFAYTPDGQFKDYTTHVTLTPTENSWYTRCTIGQLFKDKRTFEDLTASLEQPAIAISIDSVSYTVFPDFTGVESLHDVASQIETALRQVDTNLTFKYGRIPGNADSEVQVFYCYSSDKHSVLVLGGLVASGYDMFGIGNSCLTADDYYYPMGTSVTYLRYPDENYGITSYSLYRSKDIYPHLSISPDILDPRLQNNEDTFALIEDVPAAKIFMIDLDGTSGVATITGGFVVGDSFNEIKTENGVVINVLAPIRQIGAETGVLYATDYTGVDITNERAFLGASTLTSINKTGNRITSSTGYAFSESDINSVIFFEDGDTSIISGYDADAQEAITTDTRSYISAYAVTGIVSRTFYDTVGDIEQNAFLATDPLNMRFYTPMKETIVSQYNSGVLFTASDRSSRIDYCDTSKKYRIGYSSSSYQYSDHIDLDIVSMINVGDNLCVFTNLSTHVINVKQGSVQTTGYGESFFVAPDPVRVSNTIGIRNRDSWGSSGKDEAIIFTSEPAVRVFNGMSFGDNLADGSVQQTFCRKMSNSVVLDYDTSYGLTLWGTIK